jgi:hypothetical protein
MPTYSPPRLKPAKGESKRWLTAVAYRKQGRQAWPKFAVSDQGVAVTKQRENDKSSLMFVTWVRRLPRQTIASGAAITYSS